MSQLNLKQILSGDNLSVVVDKLNYNFNQIILNGGGPQGLRGLIGSPGLPGSQGLRGVTGPIGEAGTHIYASGASPGTYPFGTGGEILPRTEDIFIETTPGYLAVWELSPTGTSNYWREVEKLTVPSSALSKLIYDSNNGPIPPGTLGASATWTTVSNDPTVSGKVLIGSPDALYGNFIFNPSAPITSNIPKFNNALSSPVDYSDSLFTLAASRNQFRILDSSRDPDEIYLTTGGVLHSLETDTASGDSVYKIKHGDSIGQKHFSLVLNNASTRPTLLYSDKENRLGVGTSIMTPLVSSLVVNGGFAVGSRDNGFYLPANGATVSNGIGGIIEGNVAIGKNRNTLSRLGVYNRDTTFGADIVIDTDITTSTPSAVSDLVLGGNLYAKSINSTVDANYWRFRHDSNSSPTNSNYRKLTLTSFQAGMTSTGVSVSKNVIAFGLTANSAGVFGQVRINSEDVYDTFEVNSGVSTISIGRQDGNGSTSWMSSHIGFNLSRSPVNNLWRRSGDGTNNAGSTIWTSPHKGLGISFMGSTGGTDATGITDLDIHNSTRVYFGTANTVSAGTYAGSLILSEKNIASNFTTIPGLLVDTAAAGTTGSGNDFTNYRRYIGRFGDSTKLGSPIIATTNGLTQSSLTGHKTPYNNTINFVPHYTWFGKEQSGLFTSNINSNNSKFPNGLTGDIVGLQVNGWAGITINGTDWVQRVGIGNSDPHEFLHIGEKLVYNNDKKFIGFNLYYDNASAGYKRLTGSTASGGTQTGAFSFDFKEKDRVDGNTGLTKYESLGTSLYLTPYGLGGTNTPLTSPTQGKNYRGFIFSPPPTSPSTTGWSNGSSNVPQLFVGLTEDEAINSYVSTRRGTLALAAQYRMKPAINANPPSGPFGVTIEDQYTIGLYSPNGYPVSGIYSLGGNYAGSSVKTFGFNFLGEGGNAIAGDIPIFHASTDSLLTNAFQRTVNFGTGFRVGINSAPRPQTIAYSNFNDPIHDFASLVVGPALDGIPSSAGVAINAKGSIVIDSSVIGGSEGGNTSLIFKSNSITTSYGTTRKGIEEYYGDWAIQYFKINADEAGLNFWKPAGGSIGAAAQQNNIFYISDNGSVGIGTTDFTFKTGVNGANNGSVMGVGYGAGQPGSADDGYTEVWSAQSYINSVPNATLLSNPQGSLNNRVWRAKLAVNGITKQTGLINVSDQRFKNELARLRPGHGLERILKLDPVLYSWKEEYHPEIGGKIELGLFAQEVKEAIPEAVSTIQTDKFEDEHVLEYNAVFTTMVAAIKDLNTVVEEKDQKIKNLEDKLSKIEELLAKNGIK